MKVLLVALSLALPWVKSHGSPDLVVSSDERILDMNLDNLPVENPVDRQGTEAFYKADFEQLTQGVDRIDCRHHYPSSLTVFGSKAFPIATDSSGLANIAASSFGDGKVVAYGRGEWPMKDYEGLQAFFTNAVKWLSGKTTLSDVKVASMNSWKVNAEVGAMETNVKPGDLAAGGYDIYMVNAHTTLSETDQQTILDFIENGGGAFVGGQAWAWWQGASSNPALNFANGYPGNKILTKVGLMINGIDWSKRISPMNPMPELERNLYYALQAVGSGSSNPIAQHTITQAAGGALNPICAGMPEFAELVQKAQEIFENFQVTEAPESLELHNKLTNVLYKTLITKGYTGKAPNVADFPGEVPSTAERVSLTMTVKGQYEGYPSYFGFSQAGKYLIVSTGLYAAPGDIVTVKVAEDYLTSSKAGKNSQFGVQVGIHSDRLYGKRPLNRSPDIVQHFRITEPETKVGNPWGGGIYVTVPWGANYPDFEVTIENGVKAPRYVLGQTDLEQWKSEIRNYPAPWAEFEVPDQIIFTFPASAIRDYDDPETFLKEYERIMHDINDVAGFENNYRYRAERMTLDKQIGGGWMHSGYPMMGFTSHAKNMIKVENVRAGNVWGEYHEIGHNQQHKSYTIGRTVQAGCNIWAYHVNYNLYNKVNWRGQQGNLDSAITAYLMGGKKFQNYAVNLALQSYIVILNEVGWDVWKAINKRYYAMKAFGGSDDHKLDVFTKVFCEESKFNVAPYFQWWGYTLTEETLSVCGSFPDLENDLLARYESVDHRTVTEHGTCEDGWIPYGESCFFLSTEKMNWHDAEETCVEAGGHLASCLSSKEAYFLQDKLKKMNLNNKFFVGIDTMGEDNKARFLDGTLTSMILPWKSGQPTSNAYYACVMFKNKELEEERCHNVNQFICKKGPTACSPSWDCPEGWLRRGDKCYWIKYGGVTFQQAKDDCQSKDAEIMAINSIEENNWIVSVFKDIRWKGQYYWRNYWLDLDTKTMTWGNGEHADFPGNWCEGEEPGVEEGPVVLKSNHYCWNEGWGVNRKEAYVCEKPATMQNTNQLSNQL